MTYFYKRNNYISNKSRYQNNTNKSAFYSANTNAGKNFKSDDLIVDKNTVYEIDDDCIKKHLKASEGKRKTNT